MEQTQKLKQAVKDYREGKTEAFTSLYEESSKYIYTCIYKVMAGTDNANDVIADIMQDTYVEISKNIGQLESDDKFLYWASRTANRKCYAYLKKNKKYVLLNEEDNTFDNLSDNDSIIPEEVMQDKEKQRLVREIIDIQLTEMQKLCIVAYYYNEQKQSEIAQELGIPENTVKTNLSRAKAKIKEGVLDLEKKEGTKLYSVAPFLLLLFKEDVQAAIIPEQLTKSVMSAVSASTVSASTGIAAKGVVGKIASASLKAKIVAAIVTVGVVGGVSGTVYMASQNRAQEVVSQTVDEKEVEAEIPDTDETKSIVTEPMEETEEELYTEYDSYYLLNGVYNEGKQVDLDSFQLEDNTYTLAKSVDIYFTNEELAGYSKENIEIYVVSSNEKWYFCALDTNGFLINKEELKNAIKEKPIESEKTEETTSTSKQETSVETETETNPVAVTPEPVEETPVQSEPVEEQVVVSDKYTPEEAIAAIRSHHESNGMIWDPSIKEGASWGTGWFSLDKNALAEEIQNDFAGYQYGDGCGNSTIRYYMEVTGSDENYVYVTVWGG